METESLQERAINAMERVAVLMQIVLGHIADEFDLQICEALFLDIVTNDSVITKHQLIKRVEELFSITGNDDLCRETLWNRLNKFDELAKPLKDVNKEILQFFYIEYGCVFVNREKIIEYGTKTNV